MTLNLKMIKVKIKVIKKQMVKCNSIYQKKKKFKVYNEEWNVIRFILIVVNLQNIA